MGRTTKLTPQLQDALCAHLANGAHIKTACHAVGISEPTYYVWKKRGQKARDEPAPTLDLTRQELTDLLEEAEVAYPPRATKTALVELLTLHRQGPYIEFLEALKRAEAEAQVEWLSEIASIGRGGHPETTVTEEYDAAGNLKTRTTRTAASRAVWQAYAWLLERRHPADWSRRTELVLPDEQAAKVDPLIGVHNELRLARLARQKRLAAGSEEGR